MNHSDDIVNRLRLLSASQKAHRFADLMEDWSGEAADHIEDLMGERNLLLNDIKHLERILDKAFSHAGGHIGDCLQGMMCGCGYMHWHARQEAKK